MGMWDNDIVEVSMGERKYVMIVQQQQKKHSTCVFFGFHGSCLCPLPNNVLF